MVQNNSEIAQLKKQIETQQAIIESLKAELNWKDEQIALFKKTLFGKKTERTIISDQLELNLFNEAETYSTLLKTEPSLNYDTQKVREHERKKKRSRNIDDLEVTKVLLDLAEEDKFDPITGESLRFIGSNFRKELVHHKEYYEVIEYEQKVYAKKDDQGNEELVKKAMPTAVIPGSFATPSLLASVIDKKFTQSLPLYRQEQALERNGITLSRQTMANWMIKLHDLYFDVFVEHMHKQLLKSEYLNVDETTLEVLELLKTEGRQNCYMWLYKTGRSEDKQMAIYRFENDRKHERVKNYLNGYTNVVQSDGYAAYQNLEGVTNMGCFAHLRRGFVEAIEAAPKGTDVKNSVTQRLVNLLDELFRLEKVYNKKYKNDYDQILKARLKDSLPIYNAFYEKVKEIYPYAVKKTHLYEALTYAINNEKCLSYFLEDGRVELSNNVAERCIKDFVIGRSNFLFSNSVLGAQASGSAYSIVVSAKLNNLKPYDYIEYILNQMKGQKLTDELLEAIMPWSTTLPKELYKK